MGGADPAPAALIRVDPYGTASIAAEDLLFPNGSVITPDAQTLIVGETAGARCVRLAPGGAIVAPDGLDFFACMLGDDDGRALLMCAAPDFGEEARAQRTRRSS